MANPNTIPTEEQPRLNQSPWSKSKKQLFKHKRCSFDPNRVIFCWQVQNGVMMHLVQAAIKTRKYLNSKTPEVAGGHFTSYSQLLEMLHAIETEEVAEDKAHRWLGWVQAIICCRGEASLEELRRINLLVKPSGLTFF